VTDDRELIRGAFTALGDGPSRRELALVVNALHRAGVSEIDWSDELVELARESGASAFVALDLVTALAHGLPALTAGPRRTPR
jgi:hypothetical protein